MFIITKVNTTRKLFTTFVHEIVRIYVCYFFISSELLDKIYFFTIISLNISCKTNFIVIFVNAPLYFYNYLNIHPCYTLYSLTTFRYNIITTILNEVMFMAKRYENMDNVSTKNQFVLLYAGVKNESKTKRFFFLSRTITR